VYALTVVMANIVEPGDAADGSYSEAGSVGGAT